MDLKNYLVSIPTFHFRDDDNGASKTDQKIIIIIIIDWLDNSQNSNFPLPDAVKQPKYSKEIL